MSGAPYPGPPAPPYPTIPPPPQRSHAGILVAVIAVAVIVVVIALGAGLYLAGHGGGGGGSQSTPPPPPVTVTVTEVTWQVSGCDFTPTTAAGYTTAGGGTESLSLTMSYAGFLGFGSCTVSSASIQTGGFQLTSSNTPFTIDAGSSGVVQLVVTSPTTTYDGPLTISVTGS